MSATLQVILKILSKTDVEVT